jgi:XTP/dITP diphosphohydrolase
MSRELVVATRNQGKMKEIKQILKAFDLRITSLADYPGAPEIIEDGKTFRQNALKKATVIAQYTRKWTMGEDSGLEVKWLNNRPGIYSARFAGEHATDKKNNLKLLRELRGVPWEQREARYRCCIALVDGASPQPDPGQHVFNGSCKGKIAFRSKGTNGFGYDPLFYVSQYDTTFGVLDPAVKDRISHRSAALEKLKKHLQKCSPRL